MPALPPISATAYSKAAAGGVGRGNGGTGSGEDCLPSLPPELICLVEGVTACGVTSNANSTCTTYQYVPMEEPVNLNSKPSAGFRC